VPFLSEDGRHFQYDSSAIAHWLEETCPSTPNLIPQDPALGFLCHLIDEAFDEFGLYMVHHKRWIGSARSNTMGQRLAREFRTVLPPGGRWMLGRYFPRRQVRRCPYLFSVAPKGYRCGVPRALTPPSLKGFPPTHALLDNAWKDYLCGMETVLSQQAFLLGERFTLADASAYGQLAMNLTDPEAANEMKRRAPIVYDWLENIASGRHVHTESDAKLQLSGALGPLLNSIMGTFSALMVQNQKAYEIAREQGETCFNEPAFDQQRALYDGTLLGYPFRSVVKTFQVRVWNELRQHWLQLTDTDRSRLSPYLLMSELFELNSQMSK